MSRSRSVVSVSCHQQLCSALGVASIQCPPHGLASQPVAARFGYSSWICSACVADIVLEPETTHCLSLWVDRSRPSPRQEHFPIRLSISVTHHGQNLHLADRHQSMTKTNMLTISQSPQHTCTTHVTASCRFETQGRPCILVFCLPVHCSSRRTAHSSALARHDSVHSRRTVVAISTVTSNHACPL